MAASNEPACIGPQSSARLILAMITVLSCLAPFCHRTFVLTVSAGLNVGLCQARRLQQLVFLVRKPLSSSECAHWRCGQRDTVTPSNAEPWCM